MVDLSEILKKSGFSAGESAETAGRPVITDHCAECQAQGGKGFYRIPEYMDDTGYLVAGTIWLCKEYPCQKLTDRFNDRVAALRKTSRLPEELQAKTIDGFISTQKYQQGMKQKACWFLDKCKDRNFGGWIFLGGQSGAGKTHLASAISNELISRGRAVKYFRWTELMQSIKSFDYQPLEQARKAKVLFLDDLYKHDPTPEEAKATFDLIDHRYANGLQTIITSERDNVALQNVDTAVMGRIIERCGSCWTVLKNPRWNYRAQMQGA